MSERARRWIWVTAYVVATALLFDAGARAGQSWADHHWMRSVSPIARMSLAWTAASRDGVCRPDVHGWVASVLAGRQAIDADDSTVDLAFAGWLLRDRTDLRLSDADRREIAAAVDRCPSVLHAPCEGPRYDRAAIKRCGAHDPVPVALPAVPAFPPLPASAAPIAPPPSAAAPAAPIAPR